MSKLTPLLCCCALLAHSLSQAQAQNRPDWTNAPEWRFVQSLNASFWDCEIERRAQTLRRSSGKSVDASDLLACQSEARRKALEKLSPSINAAQHPHELKDVYAKWLTFLGTLSIDSEPDAGAMIAYQSACNTLKTELQIR
jgi:hypothetical protein